MCKLVLDRGNFADFTSVSNIFIDEYMPKANGEFIKIYLHLLRLVNSGSDALSHNLSTERIADKFNVLESDVVRALNYWSEQGLLSLSFNEKKEISGIKLESAVFSRYFVKGILSSDSKVSAPSVQNENTTMLAKVSGESLSVPVPEPSGIIVPVKRKYNAKEIAAFSKNENVNQLMMCAETYLGRPLSSSDTNSLLYMLNELGFETDFIEYIMETCISSGRKSLSSMEKQAIEYAKKGISSIEDAKADEKLRHAIFKSIYKIFGLTAKAPVKKEITYVTKWTEQYGFSDEIILEACNRTMEHTHTGSFQYTDTILTNWFKNHADSMEAIQKLDNVHSEEMTKTFKSASSPSRSKKAKAFDQRSYDYKDLEKKLRTSQNKKIKELLANQNNN
jgi:DnaD/phage-associated family protein